MDIKELYTLYRKSYLVDTDTRVIRKNSIFFALKGANFNGNEYANEALNKGAKYAIVDEKISISHPNIIQVEDVLHTLQQLANYHRVVLGIPVISLTGSNGKTTTKELINSVLSKKFKTTATIGNLNNHIGVPLTLLSMDNTTEIGIIEMGANHHKEISLLAKIAAPDYGYITNFGKAHLEGFGSIEGVIEAKSELYDFLIRNNKKIFINPNDNIQVTKTVNATTIQFDDSLQFKEVDPFVSLLYNDITIKSNLIGNYNYNNIAAAITIGQYFNINKTDIKEAIENYIPTNNRSQIITTTSNEIILDAYNANPSSMQVAIENFKLLKATNKTVILGDMFELGDKSSYEHQQIADFSITGGFENIFLVGEHFFKTKTNTIKYRTFEELATYFKDLKITEHTILIKGSRGMALERILEHIN